MPDKSSQLKNNRMKRLSVLLGAFGKIDPQFSLKYADIISAIASREASSLGGAPAAVPEAFIV